MIKTLNLKEVGSIEDSVRIMEMEIEKSKLEDVTVIKLIHGYGSHGRGGGILKEIRKRLSLLKKQGKIKDYSNGDKWNLFEKQSVEILKKDKLISGDVDLNKNNPGITIIIL